MLLTRDRIFRGSLHIRKIRACDTIGPTHNCGYSLWIYCIAQSYFADVNHHNSVVDRTMNTIGILIRHQSTHSAILGSASSTISPYIHLSLSTIICFWAEWRKSRRHCFRRDCNSRAYQWGLYLPIRVEATETRAGRQSNW